MKTINVKDSRLHAVIDLYNMQTGFFNSVLDGISDADATNRLDTKANHIAWLAGSLVQQRYDLANLLTGDDTLKQQAHDLFDNNQGIRDGVQYPPLKQYLDDWGKISPILQEALLNAEEAKLNKKVEMPGMEVTVYEMAYFTMYREANQIGQIALWRRLLDYEPMKYM